MMSWELGKTFKPWLNARMALRDDGVSSNNTKETPCSVPKTSVKTQVTSENCFVIKNN